MFRILFVCTANLYRSPLSAAFFSRKLHEDGRSDSWTVESAGTWATPGQRVPLDLLKAADECKINLNSHLTRRLDLYLLSEQDLIVVMEKGHREALRIEFPSSQKKIHLLSAVADRIDYDIADPINSDLNMHEIVVEIGRLIDRAYPAICGLIQARDTI